MHPTCGRGLTVCTLSAVGLCIDYSLLQNASLSGEGWVVCSRWQSHLSSSSKLSPGPMTQPEMFEKSMGPLWPANQKDAHSFLVLMVLLISIW